ncbi:hypothetical protein TNCV_3961061 [Trichonephila clavipes]|nr:hypothetical protein TNCV_3961061 [Trichonephila clavipes]
MDLSKGYFQIPLTPRAQRYAAFVTPFGTYIPKKMMFGLVCAPYYFCKLMAQVLEGLEQFALPYIDDIAIFPQGWKNHVKHIDIVIGRLRKAGLKVKPSKCKFAQEEVLFLGHRIGSGSRSPSDLKIKAIADFPRPSTKTHVRSFLGLVGYYSHYIPNYSTIASPLTDALKGKIKKEKITWDEKCGKAFEELKAKLVTQPILFAPDFATEFILQTDASELLESFFKNDEGHNVTVNGDRYRAIITNFFIPQLNNHDVQKLWFQQDGETCHTARATIDLLKDTFVDRLISRFGPVNWPPRSCDLTPLDYFLWGYVKSLVYADKLQTLDHLEDNIRRVIADIRPQMLEKVIENWTSRLDYIRASRGSPMPEIIFKM